MRALNHEHDYPTPVKPGDGFDCAFPLDTPGTHWMHAHTLQEQQLLAAPLIVSHDGPPDAPSRPHFQVVAVNGRRIGGARRDTVWLKPQSDVTVAFDASNPGTWASTATTLPHGHGHDDRRRARRLSFQEKKMKNNVQAQFASVASIAAQESFRRRTLAAVLATATALALLMPLADQAGAETAASGFVYTADERGNSVSRIDLASGTVEVVPVAVTPHNVQFVPGSGHILAVGAPVEADSGHGHGEAKDSHGGGDGDSKPGGTLIVLDPGSLAAGVAATIEVGSHPAHVIADPSGGRAFVTNSGDDTVSVVDLVKREAIRKVGTGDYPHGLRMSPDGSTIYVANVEDGTVSVIDAASLEEIDRIEVGKAPVQVGFTPDGKRVYVSLRDENKVAVIDAATRQVTARIEVGRSPIQMHATPDGRFVYVANQGTEAEPDETVSVIDVAGGAVVKTITAGKGAHGVTVSDDGAHVFVTNIVDGTVSEISVASQSVVRTHAVGKGPNGITFQTR